MPFLELFDETLDINSTENYDLSVEVSTDCLSFCLLDTIRNKYILIRSFGADENKYYKPEQIEEIIEKDDFLRKKFRKVKCVMPSPRFTLVPSQLYDPGKKDNYFTFNHSQQEDSVILANKIADPDAFLVFSENRPLTGLINSFYPGTNIYHHLRILLDHSCNSRKRLNGNYLSIHIERDYFSLIIFTDNVLKFCNSFSYRNTSDILYFVLNVFNNLGIGQEETLYFSGYAEKYDDLTSGFSMYVRNIKFAEPNGNFTFSYVFNDTEIHRFLNLFSAVNCE